MEEFNNEQEKLDALQEEQTDIQEEQNDIQKEQNDIQEEQNDAPAESEIKKPKKGNVLKIILTSVICVVLLGVMLVALLLGTDIPALSGLKAQVSQALGFTTQQAEATDPAAPPAAEPGETEPVATLPANVKSYTVDDAAAKENAANVVATAGDASLTNSELQIYYSMSIYDFVSQYSMFLSYMGVDFNQPLDQQMYDEETTWQQMMLENALQMWHQYTSIKMAAEKEGYQMDAEGQEYVDNIDDSFQEMLEQTDYETMDQMLAAEMGAATTVDAYRNYMLTGYYSIDYLSSMEESITPSMDEIEAYYEENKETFTANGLVKDSGMLVDVRHVLIQPEGGTTDETTQETTYSEEEWEACRQKAQALLDGWRAGEATEESFGQLAMDNSADGNAADGGLYEGVREGDMVETFNDWIFDENRKTGDSDLVKTQFGYHIMYFVDREQGEPQWIQTVRSQYLNEKIGAVIQKATEQYPVEINYDNICLTEMKMS